MAKLKLPAWTLRVAAIQPPPFSVPGAKSALVTNVGGISSLVKQATDHGAKLVLLPELALQGYSYHAKEVWSSVDIHSNGLRDDAGPTSRSAPAVAALCDLARKHQVHIGATILEYMRLPDRAHGDILNTFMLATPEGSLHQQASSKILPAHYEAFIFTSGDCFPDRSRRVLTVPSLAPYLTPMLGDANHNTKQEPRPEAIRLGISICNDSYQSGTLEDLAKSTQRPHLILAPHCCMVPGATLGFPASESAAFARTLKGVAAALASTFGVPTISTNATGPWPKEQRLPWVFAPMTSIQLRNAVFPGAGNIAVPRDPGDAAAGADVVATVGHDGQGFCVADLPIYSRGDSMVPNSGSEREEDWEARVLSNIEFATARGGSLAVPALLQRSEPLNAGSGRLWYKWHGAMRDRLVEALHNSRQDLSGSKT